MPRWLWRRRRIGPPARSQSLQRDCPSRAGRLPPLSPYSLYSPLASSVSTWPCPPPITANSSFLAPLLIFACSSTYYPSFLFPNSQFYSQTHSRPILWLFSRDHLGTYAKDYPAQFILGYCSTYIFMQTFMIPGTIFMSLLAGALFGVVRGLRLVVFNATAGASSCFFLSKLIGRPLVSWLWPEKLRFFQAEVIYLSISCYLVLNQPKIWHSFMCVQIAKRKEKLLNYMLFLRITPTLPNLFINLASPIVDIPFHIFFVATLVGLIPASYITVRVSPSCQSTSLVIFLCFFVSYFDCSLVSVFDIQCSWSLWQWSSLFFCTAFWSLSKYKW